jgi:hypothetical protein
MIKFKLILTHNSRYKIIKNNTEDINFLYNNTEDINFWLLTAWESPSSAEQIMA